MPNLSRSQILVYGAVAIALLLLGARWIRSAEGRGATAGELSVGSGEIAVLARTRWDDAAQAAEWLDAYGAAVQARFGPALTLLEERPPPAPGGLSWRLWQVPDGALLLGAEGADTMLALAPSDGPLYRGRLLRALAAFAVPAGLATALGSILSFLLVDTAFGGTLDRLNTTMSSDPPLPEYDVLALLATGSVSGDTTFSGSGGGDPDASALAAESLLYGQAAALIGARVGTLFGVDRVRIEPLTTGDSVSAARVTVGKRLSRKIYVTYSVDPSSTAQQILEVEWRLSDELTAESAARFNRETREAWERLFERMMPRLQALHERDRLSKAPRDHRVRLGVYGYAGRSGEAPADPYGGNDRPAGRRADRTNHER